MPIDYLLLTCSCLKLISLFAVVKFLERNLRMNWLVKEEINLLSVGILLVFFGFMFGEVGIAAGYILALHDTTGPFLTVFHTVPWVIGDVVSTVTYIALAFIILLRYRVRILYNDNDVKFHIERLPKGDLE